MNRYIPEGMQIHTARHTRTLDELRHAMHTDEIVTATALWCDEAHNLHVSIGGISAIIERSECALGIADGTVRDIAILSRVGKCVCCKVLDVPKEGDVRLSRAAAQREALSYFLATSRPGDVVPAVVTNLTPFGAFCDIGCGVIALLGIENICVSRISHSRDCLHEGQQIRAIVRRVEPQAQRISLSLRELLGTWEQNAARFRAGQTVTGVVRGVKEYGVFVALAPNLSGLAEPNDTLRPSDGVSVYIKAILPEKCKVKLVTIAKLDGAPAPQELPYFQSGDRVEQWQYSQADPRIVTLF